MFTHADRVADAESALKNLGYKPAIAQAAVERAQAHVGPGAGLQDFIRACLQECTRM